MYACCQYKVIRIFLYYLSVQTFNEKKHELRKRLFQMHWLHFLTDYEKLHFFKGGYRIENCIVQQSKSEMP